MHIGFIGLGIMGSRMAANLLEAGYELTVYNRTEEKAAPLLADGATWGESPAQIAGVADVLITMLSTPEVVRKVALEGGGFLDQMREGTIWVDSSTVNPTFSREMAEEARARGVHFVDAPVAGSKAPAEAGKLLVLVGGSDEDVATCQPLFDVMGRKSIHVGDNGMGTSMKMVINMLLADAMAAFSEAIALGQGLGIAQETLFETLLDGPVVAPYLSSKREKFESGEYGTEFPLRWMHKDTHLATLSAYEAGVAMPASNAVKELFAQARAAGLGEQDFSALFGFLVGQKG